MKSQSDPRFRSAAIFAADGKALKKVIQPKLKSLGWKSPGGWRAFEHRMYRYAPPPIDFGPWTQPEGMIAELSIRSEPQQASDCEETAGAALDFVGDQPARLNRNALKLASSEYSHIEIGAVDGGVNYMSLDSYDGGQDIVLPSPQLLSPWLSGATCEYGPRYTECVSFESWGIEELRIRLAQLPRFTLKVSGISSAHFAIACDALKREVAGKVTRVSHSVAIDYKRRGEVFPLVTKRVPGYFETAFFGGYAKEFDPYARPAAADAGETVRYALVTCKRPHLNKDGEKDLDIDIVHRPEGDCYFDIQALSYDPPDDQFVHNTLAEAIASLDVKAEIWDGDPFLRWQ